MTVKLQHNELQATFNPEKGMNLMSYRLGNREVIYQESLPDFEKTFSGLGPLIGPHFHRRKAHLIPKLSDDEKQKFPHIQVVENLGKSDPFSHGIGRYAPWKVEKATETEIQATLQGKDEWNGISLSRLEGQDFTMHFNANLREDGLTLNLSVVSEIDSICGIHYYYGLPEGKGVVKSRVQSHYLDFGEKKPIPGSWNIDSQHLLTYPLEQDTDVTFHPYPDPLKGKILLETPLWKLETEYVSESQENSWQLWHPKDAPFVCIEPVSSQDPRHTNLTVSSIQITLRILP